MVTGLVAESRTAYRGRLRTRGWDVVRVVLGVFLLTAAVLKLAGHSVSAVPRVGWYAMPTVQIAAAEWELVLGFWLLSGWYKVGSWLAALATFLVFASVSGYLGWIGMASCGCFGAIQASPWHAFAVDVGALSLIFLARPQNAPAEERTGSESMRLPIAGGAYLLGTAAALALVTLAGTLAYGSPEVALARLRGELVTVEPAFVSFGEGETGETLETTVRVRNWTNIPVRLIGATSDCSCIATEGLPETIPPGQSREVPIRLRLKTRNPGYFSREAFIWTDSEGQPALRLSLGCRIR
jgi:hypothetical protein